MITNPTALITGGAHGIGLGIAMQLASEGYALALMGRSDKSTYWKISIK